MTPARGAIAGNLAVFYLGWFACVAGAGRAAGTWGAGLAAMLVALHVGRSRAPIRSLQLVLASIALGIVVDGGFAAAEIAQYAGPDLPWPLPPSWILGLWGLFATTLDVALRWLDDRPVVAALLGLIGGPVSYLAGQRLDAIEFAPGFEWLPIVGLGWGAAMVILTQISRRAHQAAAVTAGQR